MKKLFKNYAVSIILSILAPILIFVNSSLQPKDGFGFSNLGGIIDILMIPFSLSIIWFITFIIKYVNERDSKYIKNAFAVPALIWATLFLISNIVFIILEIIDHI